MSNVCMHMCAAHVCHVNVMYNVNVYITVRLIIHVYNLYHMHRMLDVVRCTEGTYILQGPTYMTYCTHEHVKLIVCTVPHVQ